MFPVVRNLCHFAAPPGVDKTHTHELMEAHDEKRLRALQKQLTNVKLLIVDECRLWR